MSEQATIEDSGSGQCLDEEPVDSLYIDKRVFALGSIARLQEDLLMREVELTPALRTELEYLSYGHIMRESSSAQSIPYHVVKAHRKYLRKLFGAKTDAQLIALSIQTGTILIELDQDPQFEPLSNMQESVLRLAALGWTTDEIAKYYSSSGNTIDAYNTKIRERLQTNNNKHSIRRAFEVGIFKVGEDILDPETHMDQQTGNMTLSVAGHTFKPRELGLNHPREIELLELLSQLQEGVFRRSHMYELDFYTDAENRRVREKSFHRFVSNICTKLNTGFDQTVLQRFGKQGSGCYVFLQEITISVHGELKQIPQGIPPKPGRPRKKTSEAHRIASQVAPQVTTSPKTNNGNGQAKKRQLTQAAIKKISAREQINGTRVIGNPRIENGFVVLELEPAATSSYVEEGSDAAKEIIARYHNSKKRSSKTTSSK